MNISIWCDGSILGGNPGGHAVGGWIIKNNSKVLARGTIDLGEGPEKTNNQAEFASVYDSLAKLYALNIEKHSIILYSDSKLVVEQLNRNWNCNVKELQEYRDKIWEMCDKFDCEVVFQWVPREENQEADKISRSLYIK